MIDTIILRLYGYEKYKRTFDFHKSNKKTSTTEAWLDKESGEIIEKEAAVLLPSIIYHDTGNVFLRYHRGKSRIASSHYFINYMVNWERDFLEFNFSVPKYLYGTNIIQFIPYHDQSEQMIFQQLNAFVKNFFSSSRFIDTIDMVDVELNRVDFCYNQFFNSESDLEVFFNLQRDLLKKYNRRNGEVVMPFETSLMIKHDAYSFKIYRKLPEFLKHDYKELQKRNPKGYDLEFLKQQASRILRYECTFRNAYMNYAFKRIYYDASKIKHKQGSLVAVKENKFAKKGAIRTLFKVIRIDHKAKTGLFAKQFMFRSIFDDAEIHYKTGKRDWFKPFVGVKTVTFNFPIFHYLYKRFWSYVREFQVSHSVSFEAMEKKLEIINEDAKLINQISGLSIDGKNKKSMGKKLTNARRLKMYAFLSTTVSLKELYRKDLISKRSYFYTKKKLEMVGLGEYNPDVCHIKPLIDYTEYRAIFNNMMYYKTF